MKKPTTVRALEELGRVQLSPSFFLRDFLHSEIAQMEGVANIPDDPDLAIRAGRRLCQEVLEPIQARFGRVSIRSGYRSSTVNALGAADGNHYNCSRNEANHARHIWDVRDRHGCIGAMACIVVNGFLPYYDDSGDWPALAWWIHDHVPGYSTMHFFPRLAALNIGWHERPAKTIKSYAPPKGILTRPGMPGHDGRHDAAYDGFLGELAGR